MPVIRLHYIHRWNVLVRPVQLIAADNNDLDHTIITCIHLCEGVPPVALKALLPSEPFHQPNIIHSFIYFYLFSARAHRHTLECHAKGAL